MEPQELFRVRGLRVRDLYQAPKTEDIFFKLPQNLLVTLSIEGDVEDFEDGGDI